MLIFILPHNQKNKRTFSFVFCVRATNTKISLVVFQLFSYENPSQTHLGAQGYWHRSISCVFLLMSLSCRESTYIFFESLVHACSYREGVPPSVGSHILSADRNTVLRLVQT